MVAEDDDGNAGSNVNGKKPVKNVEQKAEQKMVQQPSVGKTVKDLMALVEKYWRAEAPEQAEAVRE